MDVRCEKCSTEYEFDEERVGANGVTVKCTACGYVFKVRRPRKAPPPRATTTLGKGPQGREWLVRKPDSQMIAFRELTTLQKWIVEGRIARDDEISKNGETWKRLGNILELEPFFSVYEKARALNELIERGGAEGSPVTLRGSEVLATMSPLSSLPLDEAGQSLPPGRGPTITGDLSRASSMPARASTNALSMTPIPLGAPPPLPSAAPSAELGSEANAERSPPGRFTRPGTGSDPASEARSEANAERSPPGRFTRPGTGMDPASEARSEANAEHSPPGRFTRPGTGSDPTPPRAGANGVGTTTGSISRPKAVSGPSPAASLPSMPAPPPPLPAAARAERTPVFAGLTGPTGGLDALPSPSLPGPGLLGPAAIDVAASRAAPATWPKSSLSMPLDDGFPANEDTDVPTERTARSKRIGLWAGALVALGLGGGVALATLGPDGNPLQVVGEKLHLMQPRIVDDGASRPIEEAQRAFDLDTLASLEKAEALLTEAERLRPDDPAVRGDRALVMVTRAEALRRAAADMGAAADEAKKVRAAWQLTVAEITAKNAVPGALPQQVPPEPKTSDAAALEVEMTKNSELASAVLKQAFDLAASAYKQAPEAFAPARALSEYYRVQQDQASYARELARAKAVVEKSGATDPALLYGEAAAKMGAPRPTADDLTKAGQLLEQALSTRPSMNRARVLLARLHLARQSPELASAELDRVLTAATEHAEARWLRDVVQRQLDAKAAEAAAAGTAQPGATQPGAAQPGAAQPGTAQAGASGTVSGATGAVTEGGAAQGTAPSGTAPGGAAKGADDRATQDLKNGAKLNFDGFMATADRHRERDRPKLALAAYEKAADLKPMSAEPLTGMGWAYIDLEKPEAALAMFKRAMKVNDRYVEAYYGAAEAHRALGHKDEAIAMYEQYLARAPSGPDRKAAQRALENLKGQ